MTETPIQNPPDRPEARRLFSYLGGEEYNEYRAILSVFANTFFTEFTPDDVAANLGTEGTNLATETVAARLESLVGWGNLTVSSSVGNPSSLADYYRRRNRYLITRAGQEVYAIVEDVLARVDEVRDVATGRLGSLRDALVVLATLDIEAVATDRLADVVRQVFDPHAAFTNEITQFFAAINHWQSRYDLDADELTFFADVLVGYVGDRIHEIERTSRPIRRLLADLEDRIGLISSRVRGDLVDRVDRAGLGDRVTVSHVAGSSVADWEHLAAWFVSVPGRPSRIDDLTRQAVSAVRTLTMNLTRLSRVGLGATSRRADLLALAAMFADESVEPDRVAAAAFGLYPPVHLGVLSEDADDPEHPGVSWWEAPKALVPVSIRARGDTTNRGRVTPLRDRSDAQELIRHRRRQLAEARQRVDVELVQISELDGAVVSMAALGRIQQLLDRSTRRHLNGNGVGRVEDGEVTCVVTSTHGRHTTITCPEGRLVLEDVAVQILPREPVSGDEPSLGARR